MTATVQLINKLAGFFSQVRIWALSFLNIVINSLRQARALDQPFSDPLVLAPCAKS